MTQERIRSIIERRKSRGQCTYPGHVESVEESLDRTINVRSLDLFLELEDTLCHSRDDGIVASFDVRENSGESFVVVVNLGRPFKLSIWIRVVSSSQNDEVRSGPRTHSNGIASEYRTYR